jgi:hypothetical protein
MFSIRKKKSNLPVGFVPAVAVRGFVPPVDTEVVPVTKVTEVVSTLLVVHN